MGSEKEPEIISVGPRAIIIVIGYLLHNGSVSKWFG